MKQDTSDHGKRNSMSRINSQLTLKSSWSIQEFCEIRSLVKVVNRRKRGKEQSNKIILNEWN